MLIDDWNGRPVSTARSRGGVLALSRVADALLDVAPWPQPEVLQKLYKSNRETSFSPDELAILTADLGYYCDLQSVHSEDTITFNFFGTMGSMATQVLNWLGEQLGMPGGNDHCDVSLWRRIPHPETLVSGGPELDALLVGDRTVVAVEAKWRSKEGVGQGTAHDRTQLDLRNEWFAKFGPQVFGDRNMLVVGVSAYQDDLLLPESRTHWVTMAAMTWRQLESCSVHPHIDEYRRYHRWKVEHSTWGIRRGSPVADP